MSRQAHIIWEGRDDFSTCQIKDINTQGLQLSLVHRLPIGRNFKFRIVVDDALDFEAKAAVSWHKSIGCIELYGLRFSDISESAQERIQWFANKDYPAQAQLKKEENIMRSDGVTQNTGFSDKRIFARFSKELPARFIDSYGNKEGFARTQDISAKGLGLLVNEEIRPNSSLEMWLTFADKDEPFYTRGKVVWSKMLKPDMYRIGVNLERADLMSLTREFKVV